MYGPEQAESVELPLMRIFGGNFRSTARVPNQRETVTTEDWRSLRLDIQVRFFSHSAPTHVLGN
jgi:hypothetical protein